MYVDDTVVFASAKTPQLAAKTISEEMSGVSSWFRYNHLTLNYKKTVSKCFSIKRKANENSRVKIGEIEIEIDLVEELKF